MRVGRLNIFLKDGSYLITDKKKMWAYKEGEMKEVPYELKEMHFCRSVTFATIEQLEEIKKKSEKDALEIYPDAIDFEFEVEEGNEITLLKGKCKTALS